jgi:PIN domain nuclease of toxin-antitoxin system
LIVVDTHAAIWLTQEPTQISAGATRVLTEARNSGGLAIADITLREIAWLAFTGRISVRPRLAAYLDFVESLFQVIPISGRIAERSMQFTAAYPRDPADRLIGATAVVHVARLVTKDELIRRSGEVECVW